MNLKVGNPVNLQSALEILRLAVEPLGGGPIKVTLSSKALAAYNRQLLGTERIFLAGDGYVRPEGEYIQLDFFRGDEQ